MAGKWSKIAMESCASWESTRATAHFARKMVEKWRHIREETKRKMALLKRKTRFRQSMGWLFWNLMVHPLLGEVDSALSPRWL